MRTHSILKTYINKNGQMETRRTTGFHGASDENAVATFNTHVAHAERDWKSGRTWNGVPIRITAIVLIDANENVLAEWTYEPKAQVA